MSCDRWGGCGDHSPALPVLTVQLEELPRWALGVLVTVADIQARQCRGGRGLRKRATPVSCGDEWQGVSWEEAFLSLTMCQGLLWGLFTYLISEEGL